MELPQLIKVLSSNIDKTKSMLEALIEDYPIPAISILTKIDTLEIVGEDLYRFYELSHKDFYLMQHLCFQVPNDILVNVCKRTGNKDTIKPYINTYSG